MSDFIHDQTILRIIPTNLIEKYTGYPLDIKKQNLKRFDIFDIMYEDIENYIKEENDVFVNLDSLSEIVEKYSVDYLFIGYCMISIESKSYSYLYFKDDPCVVIRAKSKDESIMIKLKYA